MDVADAITALTEIGVFPVIAVAALLTVATMVYKRFRR
jgi:hypothetical protein